MASSSFARVTSSNAGTTVVDPVDLAAERRAVNQKTVPSTFAPGIAKANYTPFIRDPVNYLASQRNYFVPIVPEKGGLIGALYALDAQMRDLNGTRLVSKKRPWVFIGRSIGPGQIGVYETGAMPRLIIKQGRYPGMPLSNWLFRSYKGTLNLGNSVIQASGVTAVQVSQNQAAVIADPQNRIFVVKNGGFVALDIEGPWKVLALVDQCNLTNTVNDPANMEKRILGHRQDVTQMAIVNGRQQSFVVATFLDIPANNVAVLQRGDDLEVLPAGQHCITDPNVTIRNFFSKGESQFEMPASSLWTKDQVPVSLKMYLRWQLDEPLKLCLHGYSTPYAALKDKTLSILTQVISHLEYSSMIRQRGLGPELDDHDPNAADVNSAFLEALRNRAMDDLHEAALEYGIQLKDLAVIDRSFGGQVATTMDKLTTRALQAQVEASNVDRENSNKVKQEQGALLVAKVKADQVRTEADAAAYQTLAKARAEAEATKIAAEAKAEATRLAAQADADSVALKAKADALVGDSHARTVQLARVEVQRIQAYGNKAVFVPASDGNLSSAITAGLGLGVGQSASK